jgi:hypothetical protein
MQAFAMSVEMTNVHGIHIELSTQQEFVVSFDSPASGTFSGVICAPKSGSLEEIAAVIHKAEQDDVGLDVKMEIGPHTMCLAAVKMHVQNEASAGTLEKIY